MKKGKLPFIVIKATSAHYKWAETIAAEMEESAKARGTGIAKRSPDYLRAKMQEGKAIIAFTYNDEWAGFCYIEAWQHEQYVANSGLIVAPKYRNQGLSQKIKEETFKLSRKMYPNSKIFGLTTGAAVMKINSKLGYFPVAYQDLTHDPQFWQGCQSCVNYNILQQKERKNCLCTAMLYDVSSSHKEKNKMALRPDFQQRLRLFKRWVRFKKHLLLKNKNKPLQLAFGSGRNQPLK
ncbi:MAG: GNAT family N-acetyltransferase [Cyclobacteriaceae bacterium]|nr:GNAT family N-acetyltransferase [Cyclobacteriaceae bacterium]MCH8515723.1 GNAT family N-acetyltransferase [Cyclobacteriaceae bacterium]